MTKRPLWNSTAAQAALFSGALALAWLWDALASGHLQQQLARFVLGCALLAGVFVWMNRPAPPGRLHRAARRSRHLTPLLPSSPAQPSARAHNAETS